MPTPARVFLDTNVFVYTFDDRDPDKRDRARDLVERCLSDGSGVASFQVVQEFLNVASRRFATPLTPADCRRYLDRVLLPMCHVHSGDDLYRLALDVQERWQHAFYDSLILAAALSARCETLYSEDLQHGQSIRELTIVDPFRE